MASESSSPSTTSRPVLSSETASTIRWLANRLFATQDELSEAQRQLQEAKEVIRELLPALEHNRKAVVCDAHRALKIEEFVRLYVVATETAS